MVTNITLNDPESVNALAEVLAAAQGTGQLNEYQESVVDSVLTSCHEQEPALDPDAVERNADMLRLNFKNFE